MTFVEASLTEHGRRFAVSDVAGRRGKQFRDLVTVLKLAAIDFDDGLGSSEQYFGNRLYGSGLAGTRRSHEQEVSSRTPLGNQTRAYALECRDNAVDGVVLSDNSPSQFRLK